MNVKKILPVAWYSFRGSKNSSLNHRGTRQSRPSRSRWPLPAGLPKQTRCEDAIILHNIGLTNTPNSGIPLLHQLLISNNFIFEYWQQTYIRKIFI
jgi:hypothetical protein